MAGERAPSVDSNASSPGTRYLRHSWLFALGFALLISHELDAMIRDEWLLLPGFHRVAEQHVADVFNLLHVPIFAVVIWLTSSANRIHRWRTMVVAELFMVAHAIAHTALRGASDYRFEGPVETITVYGAALASAAHLAVGRRS